MYKKFHESARRQTWGAELCANEFDHNLWGPLFKRVNFECRNSGERKLKRPALNLGVQFEYLNEVKNTKKAVTKDDVEIVYPDIILDGDGRKKADSIHAFVPDIFPDLPGVSKDKTFEDGGIKQFLKMMTPPYTNDDPEIRKNQVISLTFSLALHYYRFIVDQCGGCPALVIGSYETSTAKTLTTKLVLKTVSDGSHFLAQSSSEQSVNSLKSKTSLPFAIDDIETKAIEHKIILSSFNGATKTTIGRGKEKPLAGLIISKNFKENEVMEEKDDEGRTFVQIFDKKIEGDIEDAYEAEAEHADVMDDNVLCRDFLAKMTSKFLKNKGEKSIFQEKHQAACGVLAERKPGYGNRKVKSYALALCAFLLVEEEVEELQNKEIQQLFVEVYKDRATFIENLLDCFEKTDALLDNHIRRRAPAREQEERIVGNHDPEEVLTLLLDKFEGKSLVEITNVVKGFTRKNGMQVIAVAHTKLKKIEPTLAKTIKELKESDGITNEAITSGINTFTKPKADRHIGASNTESKTSIEFSFHILSNELIGRIREMFDIPVVDENPEADISEDDQVAQSQDYPGLYQSQGRDTMKFCSLCDFATRCVDAMETHASEHPGCNICKKRFVTEAELQEHIAKKHTTYNCTVCRKEIPSEERASHENMHEKHKKQLKGLEKGKVTKAKKKTKTTGYNVFVKEKFAEISAEQQQLSNAEVMKIVGARWKSLSKADQSPYCDLADGRNTPNVEAEHESTFTCVFCDKKVLTKDLLKTHMKSHMGSSNSGNQLNRFGPDAQQDQIKKCNVCGLMLNKNTLTEHMKSHDEIQVQNAVENEVVQDDVADVTEEPALTVADVTEEPELTLEESSGPTNNDVTPSLVLVKLRTKYWPAQVKVIGPDTYDVILCKRGEEITVKKKDVKPFVPDPELMKGQSREWKMCYQVALESISE